MFNPSNFQYENCGKKCKNPEHGERITGVLLKNSLSDDKVAAFIAKTCRNFAHVLDHQVGFYFFDISFFSFISYLQ